MIQKVFVIGFQKTGTTSLEHALQFLGYRVYSGDKTLMKFNNKKELQAYISATLINWDAVQDMPWPLFYKDLYLLYPNAKFILTIRDTNSWIDSVVKYFSRIRIPLHKKIYGVPCAEGYEDVYKRIYEKHNEDVINFFKDKNNFIIMEQHQNFDYDTLCNFLEIPNIPNIKFPHQRNNSGRRLPKYKLYRFIRSFYWNIKKNY